MLWQLLNPFNGKIVDSSRAKGVLNSVLENGIIGHKGLREGIIGLEKWFLCQCL